MTAARMAAAGKSSPSRTCQGLCQLPASFPRAVGEDCRQPLKARPAATSGGSGRASFSMTTPWRDKASATSEGLAVLEKVRECRSRVTSGWPSTRVLKFIPLSRPGHYPVSRIANSKGQRGPTARSRCMEPSKGKSRWGTWLVLAVLAGLLGLAVVELYVGWSPGEDDVGEGVSGAGYIAMTLGILATLALGIGLMALMFFSNRSGRD